MTNSAIHTLLQQRGIAWPAPIERFESLGSTNDLLRERARGGALGWHVVMAQRQTAGRGRLGRRWVSRAGDLFLSLLLRPGDVATEVLAVLPLMAGVAVSRAADEWGVPTRLKWPNDVLVGGQKLAGILAEASSAGLDVEHVVLGVGMNLALDPPEHLRGVATSVYAETGQVPTPDEAAAAVLAAFLDVARRFAPKGASAVVSAWCERSVDWWGREVEVASGGSRIAGRALGVDEDGALVLETGSGRIRVLSGEARALRLAEQHAPEGIA
ncbi:MAG TPA: biotin--[acetyl-CoA-carboxylase] ligase [Vicinamibacteria bacterium]|nr:biotin--[acetyl-CoA-carboxylase] ligase [Vicinamibacteria bacterium]